MVNVHCEFWAILFLSLLISHATADPVEDKQALLDFVSQIPHYRSLNWNESSLVCNYWTGVTCSDDESRVIAVRLPGVGFQGSIPSNTISRLSALQILSLRSNSFNGFFPYDFYKMKNLSYLYLQFNDFSGPLPSDFSVWNNLTIVNLSNNRFNGAIPSSISNSTQLLDLNLANNLLSGEIPDLQLSSLQQINLSNNLLTGSIPKSLLKFPSSVFAGNNMFRVPPVGSPIIAPSNKPNSKSSKSERIHEFVLWGIIIACSAAGVVTFATVIAFCIVKRKKKDELPRKLQKGEMSPEKVVSRNQDANNRMVIFEGCSNYAFDLEDLLRASAEVLGKGTFGIAYKAALEDATTVVVKRLKEVSAGKRDFEQQMELVGSIRHENVVDLKAYYYSKDEKLMVYDYFSQGSVSSMLHGRREEEGITLNWDTRMRIAIGSARGIGRIHMENGGKLVHGNIKSSNIFLNSQQYGCISDIGLATIMSPLPTPLSRAAGYRAPEITDTRKATQASDIYSFGVVLLELLTRKSPVHTTAGDEIVHLVRWVHSVVREEWTAEVFDLELLRYVNIEEEMVEMLQIALSCVVRVPDQRPKITDVVKMIENVRRVDNSGNTTSSDKRVESSTT